MAGVDGGVVAVKGCDVHAITDVFVCLGGMRSVSVLNSNVNGKSTLLSGGCLCQRTASEMKHMMTVKRQDESMPNRYASSDVLKVKEKDFKNSFVQHLHHNMQACHADTKKGSYTVSARSLLLASECPGEFRMTSSTTMNKEGDESVPYIENTSGDANQVGEKRRENDKPTNRQKKTKGETKFTSECCQGSADCLKMLPRSANNVDHESAQQAVLLQFSGRLNTVKTSISNTGVLKVSSVEHMSGGKWSSMSIVHGSGESQVADANDFGLTVVVSLLASYQTTCEMGTCFVLSTALSGGQMAPLCPVKPLVTGDVVKSEQSACHETEQNALPLTDETASDYQPSGMMVDGEKVVTTAVVKSEVACVAMDVACGVGSKFSAADALLTVTRNVSKPVYFGSMGRLATSDTGLKMMNSTTSEDEKTHNCLTFAVGNSTMKDTVQMPGRLPEEVEQSKSECGHALSGGAMEDEDEALDCALKATCMASMCSYVETLCLTNPHCLQQGGSVLSCSPSMGGRVCSLQSDQPPTELSQAEAVPSNLPGKAGPGLKANCVVSEGDVPLSIESAGSVSCGMDVVRTLTNSTLLESAEEVCVSKCALPSVVGGAVPSVVSGRSRSVECYGEVAAQEKAECANQSTLGKRSNEPKQWTVKEQQVAVDECGMREVPQCSSRECLVVSQCACVACGSSAFGTRTMERMVTFVLKDDLEGCEGACAIACGRCDVTGKAEKDRLVKYGGEVMIVLKTAEDVPKKSVVPALDLAKTAVQKEAKERSLEPLTQTDSVLVLLVVFVGKVVGCKGKVGKGKRAP